jgi:hypothetical protein
MNLLLPACNRSMDDAHGCLFGPPPTLFGGSRCAILDVWHIVYDVVCPHLPNTPLAAQIDSWFAFQEFFGLHSSTLQKGAKSARAFFVCCFFCNEAWDTLLSAANAAGPINIHGCLAKITKFPPKNKKQGIIIHMNQHAKDFQDLHPVHMDRLHLLDPEDEKLLLLLTQV